VRCRLVTDEPNGYARARSTRVRSLETAAAVRAEEWTQRRLANLTMDLFGTMRHIVDKEGSVSLGMGNVSGLALVGA